jgi:radical SAM protein with 4Fe4S-binding SPASM domain
MSTCLVPFNQLYIHSSGEVYPCSFVQNDPNFILGHIQEKSLKEIWNSDAARKLRDAHQGILPGACKSNQQSFLCHKVITRNGFNQTDLKLKRLDIMLDSACNLTCIMCTNIYDRTGGLKSDYFWKNNDEVLSELNEIELVGGEPLISPHFERMVNLVSPINSKCEWRITTNAHYQITDNLLGNFQKINLKSISISLDSLVPGIFEKIRQRSQFDLVFNNILKLKKSIPKIEINMVVQTLNANEVTSLYMWTKKQGFHFYPILLLYPKDHSLLNRSKKENREWLLNLMRENESLNSKEIFFLIKKALANLELQKDPEVLEAYLEQLKLMEKIIA